MFTLPEDSKLRAKALSTSPNDFTPYSVTVDFSSKKCVSDINGNFPSDGKLKLHSNCCIFMSCVNFNFNIDFWSY